MSLLTLVSHFISVYLNGLQLLSSSTLSWPCFWIGSEFRVLVLLHSSFAPSCFHGTVCYPFNLLFFSPPSLCLLLLRNKRLKRLTLTYIVHSSFPLVSLFIVCVCEREKKKSEWERKTLGERGGEGERKGKRDRSTALFSVAYPSEMHSMLCGEWQHIRFLIESLSIPQMMVSKR